MVMSKGFEKISSLDSYKYKYFPCSGVPAIHLLIQSRWNSIGQICNCVKNCPVHCCCKMQKSPVNGFNIFLQDTLLWLEGDTYLKIYMYKVMLIELQSVRRCSELLVMRLILSTSQRAENNRKAVVFLKNEYF